MSQKRALAQEIRLGSPEVSPRKRVGSGDETKFTYQLASAVQDAIARWHGDRDRGLGR